MNKLINETNDFGFFWSCDEIERGWYFGEIKILIGETIYPAGNDELYTLKIVFSNLKESFVNKYYPAGITKNGEFGEKNFDVNKWGKLTLKDVFAIEVTELGGGHTQLGLCMGYSGDSERLFYSFDNEKSFNEIRYPKGTVEKIIFSLPDFP
ncbi:hypothetical protein ACWA5Z_04175 [Testudinibacter sp. P80/BLE/0925]|uniref:hypothetical protein n=1 Tax=Testudinibacter sp. TW-1 TaxID=3417757 RepID=UPI003D369DD3